MTLSLALTSSFTCAYNIVATTNNTSAVIIKMILAVLVEKRMVLVLAQEIKGLLKVDLYISYVLPSIANSVAGKTSLASCSKASNTLYLELKWPINSLLIIAFFASVAACFVVE